MTFVARGSVSEEISPQTLSSLVAQALGAVEGAGRLIAPARQHQGSFSSRPHHRPDYQIGRRLAAVLPAIGTHAPMTEGEIASMYPETPGSLFKVHDWRRDLVELDRIPSTFVRDAGAGVVDYDYPVQANKMFVEEGFDAIISIGQVVPHEVVGMANHAKNIFVGRAERKRSTKAIFRPSAFGMENDGKDRYAGKTDLKQGA